MANNVAASETATAFSVLCYLNIFLCALALLTSIIFEKQRRFPVSLVMWVSCIGLFYNIWLVVETSPVLTLFTVHHRSEYCNIATTIVTFFAFASLMTNTLLSFTIFNLVRWNNNMDPGKHPWYRRIFVAIFWASVLAISLSIGLGEVKFEQIICGPATLAAAIFVMVMIAVGLLAQAVFIFLTLAHMKTVAVNVSGQLTSKELKARKLDSLMYTRFVSIIVIQIVQWFPVHVFWIQYVISTPSHNALLTQAFLNVLGTFLESIVIMASNRSLRGWILVNVMKREHGHSSSSDIHKFNSVSLATPSGSKRADGV